MILLLYIATYQRVILFILNYIYLSYLSDHIGHTDAYDKLIENNKLKIKSVVLVQVDVVDKDVSVGFMFMFQMSSTRRLFPFSDCSGLARWKMLNCPPWGLKLGLGSYIGDHHDVKFYISHI